MFTVIYRWRIKNGFEQQFIESWSEITKHYLENFDGARGSRLHRGGDGFWYAYAQWKSDEHRQNAFQNRPNLPARAKLIEAIEESFPEIRLEIVADFLQNPEKI
jgi:heme-degrading monooxygenase HmoA